jgi:hypothetical protein
MLKVLRKPSCMQMSHANPTILLPTITGYHMFVIARKIQQVANTSRDSHLSNELTYRHIPVQVTDIVTDGHEKFPYVFNTASRCYF